jgi:membrane-associated phospholipid phosphatase
MQMIDGKSKIHCDNLMDHLSQRWPLRAGTTGWLIAAGACIVLVGAVGAFDAQISHFGQGMPAAVVAVAAFVTNFGESSYVLIPALVLWLISSLFAAIIPKPGPKRALWQMAGIWAFVFIGVGLAGLFTSIAKRIIGRGRPAVLDGAGAYSFEPGSWIDWVHQSFPSGHTTTAFATCFVVSFLAPRSYPVMLALAVAVALSRVVLGAHFATDLIAGAVVGTLGAYLVRNAFASRRWVFERRADGAIVRRPLVAVRRLMERPKS